MKQPLIVNLGLGVDSVAMLVGLQQRGEKPDLVIFADTGGEKPETLAYRDVLDPWLVSVGFPTVTVVKRPVGRANYSTLEQNCLQNETLPSLAFNLKGCSVKWKAEAMDSWLLGISRGKNKRLGWMLLRTAKEFGLKAVKCIGYDAGPKDSKRGKDARTEDDNFIYRYPLREWGWDRERCIQEIILAGLPVPIKSACFFCPASQAWELYWLAGRHPELFLRAIAIEDRARAGKHGLNEVKGLWGRDTGPTKKNPDGKLGSWRDWAERQGILVGDQVVMPKEKLLLQAAAMKPSVESNVCTAGAA